LLDSESSFIFVISLVLSSSRGLHFILSSFSLFSSFGLERFCPLIKKSRRCLSWIDFVHWLRKHRDVCHGEILSIDEEITNFANWDVCLEISLMIKKSLRNFWLIKQSQRDYYRFSDYISGWALQEVSIL